MRHMHKCRSALQYSARGHRREGDIPWWGGSPPLARCAASSDAGLRRHRPVASFWLKPDLWREDIGVQISGLVKLPGNDRIHDPSLPHRVRFTPAPSLNPRRP